jgi:hypothetical protein
MSSECQCSLRTKLVGDGCQFCNPQYAADHSGDDPNEPIPYTLTEAGRKHLEGGK